MAKMTLNTKGMIFGMVGAFVGAVPVSILKLIIILRLWELCLPFGNWPNFPIFPTRCGLFYNTWEGDIYSLTAYVIFIFLGGALAGYLGLRLGLKRALMRDVNNNAQKWRGNFWWSFFAGILFDLLFVFIFLYPGQ